MKTQKHYRFGLPGEHEEEPSDEGCFSGHLSRPTSRFESIRAKHPYKRALISSVRTKQITLPLILRIVTGLLALASTALAVDVAPPASEVGKMVYDTARQEAVLYGVIIPSNVALTQTWVWNGGWQLKSPVASPPGVKAGALAYDEARQQTVFFGGSITPTNTPWANNTNTWTWDGTNWSMATPATRPQGRWGMPMAYDSLRQQVVLFGGSTATQSELRNTNDTWVWNGTDWALKNPANRPSVRQGHGLVFDVARGQTVLFGGMNNTGGGGDFNDTWVWNGTNWTQKFPASSPPSLSILQNLTYDSVRQEVVLFGGFMTSGVTNGTWVWNGTNWSHKTPLTRPVARTGHMLTFDPSRGKTVMFGGENSSSSVMADTWLWNGTNWSSSDMTLSVETLPSAVYVYSNLTYSVSVTNMGPSIADEVVLVHELPASVDFVSASSSQGTCAYDNGKVACTVGSVPLAAQVIMTVVVTPRAVGTITNTVTVLCSAELNPSNNVAKNIGEALGPVTPIAVIRVNGEYHSDNVHMIDSSNAPAPVSITIEGFPPQAPMHYTLDGSTPQVTSPLYAGQFDVVPPAQVRAAVFDGGVVGYSPPVFILPVPYYFLTNDTPGGGTITNFSSGPYKTNTQVTLTANPSDGWSFLRWEGDAAGTNSVVTLTMNGPRSAKAVFGHPLTVSIQSAAGANGTVSNAPASPIYAYGQTVLLSGLPDANSLLAGWGQGGAAEFTANPLPLVIDENHTSITAYFLRKPETNLLLNVTVTGEGVVTRAPDASSYPSNAFVTLYAVAAPDHVFDKWQSGATGSQNPITLQLTTNLTVQALFVPRVPPVVVLFAPQNGDSITGPTNVLLTAAASSSNSDIQRLEFYEGTNLLAVVTTNATSLTNTVTLTNLPPRTNAYALVARALDARGLEGFSATNLLTVQPAPGYVTFGFLPTPIAVPENLLSVPVRIFKFGAGTGSVFYATEAITAQPVENGIGDFIATNGMLNFASNQTYGDIFVPLADDLVFEGNETFAIRLGPQGKAGLTGTGRYVVTIVDSTYLSAVSFLENVPPPAPPLATNSLRVWLEPLAADGAWRFVWETTWRTNGTSASNLVAGNYDLEFLPLPGFAPLPTTTVAVTNGGENLFTNNYLAIGDSPKGALTVRILPFAPTADWENTGWRFSGHEPWNSVEMHTLDGLAEGVYTLEFKPVPNWVEPDQRSVRVWARQQTDVVVAYTPVEPSTTALTLTNLPSYDIIRDSATNDPKLPYTWVGQLRAGGSWGSGTVVRERVVLTAGHVVFDAVRLAAAGEVFWFPQRQAGEYEPKPLRPRGWLLLNGYSAGLQADRDANRPVQPETQNLDAAALYFSSAATRGGYSGYLADGQGEWLTGTTNHMLVGYPTRGAAYVQRDKMHRTPPGDYYFTNIVGAPQVFLSTNFVGFPGASGGPLCVLHSNGVWYPAGIYLGVTANRQARVRAIDGELVALIQQAVDAANASEDETDPGPGPIIPITGLTNTSPWIQLRINVEPPDLITTLQALNTNLWCQIGNGTNFSKLHFTNSLSVTTPLLAIQANYILFGPVAGWQTPATINISTVSGQDVTINARYESNAPPTIILNPADVAGLLGYSAELKGEAIGAGPLGYQWLKDGTPTMLTTDPLLRFPILSHSNAGWYTLRATNAFGAVTSSPVRLVIGPAVQWQATNLLVLGTLGRTVIIETASQINSNGFDWVPWRTNIMTNNQQLIDTAGWLNSTQQSGFLRLKVLP